MMENISKNIAIYGAILIFLGYCNMHFFYIYFDIPIYYFIEINEILISFLPILVPIILTTIVFLSLIIFRASKYKGQEPKESTIKEKFVRITKFDTFKERKNLIISILLYLVDIISFVADLLGIVLLIILIMGIGISLYDKSPLNLSSFLAYTFIIVLITLNLIIKIDNKIEKLSFEKKDLIRQRAIIIEYTTILVIIVALNCHYRATRLLSGKPFNNISISFIDNKDKIQTNNKLVFLGKTNNFLFCRDLRINKNYIFRMDKISEIEIEGIK